MFIDSHCHCNGLSRTTLAGMFEAWDAKAVLIDSSIDYNSSLVSAALAQEYTCIFSALGFHPFCADQFSLPVLAEYEKLIAQHKKIVAIGEIGLDSKAKASLEVQENVFRAFIELALKKNLPVMIHNRMESERAFEILDDYYARYDRVVFHCFSYGQGLLKKILNKGGWVSFSLNIVRKKEQILESLRFCPLENLFLETDSPYMLINGKPSLPAHIKDVYSFAAHIKGIPEEKLIEGIYANGKKVFGI